MRILVWHVHGSWTTSFVHGGHSYLVPVTPNRDADGRGRARTFRWPPDAVEITPDELRDTDVDVVVLQRPHEFELTEKWLGRRPGRDVPAVFVEHNAPRGEAASSRHPLADRTDVPVVHVTHFNRVFWDTGRAPVRVVEHGIVDPGHRYTGELPRAAAVINEPVRRTRVAGTDLLPGIAAAAPLDVFGMGVRGLSCAVGHEDLPQHRMHAELAARRVYVHPYRWTSLGLSLLEAMHLGMPVVALAATEAVEAVPREAGVLSTNPDELAAAVGRFVDDPDLARRCGTAARAAVRHRYGLDRFLAAWDELLEEVRR
ncbi:glycosyltransferase [Saccharopolyspora rosea]|uniref:Glycosyltransferase n=1 Tax=Saccharopolyspora rosea TaxID=524884 RepID=A0ABW3G4B0_9PSEU|nr:glycosyltransferase [Saccharopolyspora rosea]